MKGTKKGKGGIVLSGLLLVVFATVVWVANGYPAKARLGPFWVGLCGLVLAVVQFGLDARRLLTASPVEAGKGANDEPAGSEKKHGMSALTTAAWVLGCFGLILLVGFWIGSAVFLVAFLRGAGKESWKLTLLSTAASIGGLYLLFEVVLKIMMFRGFLLGATLAG